MRNLERNVPPEGWREVKAMALTAYHASSHKAVHLVAEELPHAYARGF